MLSTEYTRGVFNSLRGARGVAAVVVPSVAPAVVVAAETTRMLSTKEIMPTKACGWKNHPQPIAYRNGWLYQLWQMVWWWQ